MISTNLDAGSLLPLATLSGYFIQGRRRSRGAVCLFQPLLQQWFQFTHVLKAQLKCLESRGHVQMCPGLRWVRQVVIKTSHDVRHTSYKQYSVVSIRICYLVILTYMIKYSHSCTLYIVQCILVYIIHCPLILIMYYYMCT